MYDSGDIDNFDDEFKFGWAMKSYFVLSDAIQIASILRFSLSEKSLYCPCGNYMNIFWLTCGLVAPENSCGNEHFDPSKA